MVGEAGQQRRVAVLGGVLERADAQVAAGDAGQHGTGQHRVPGDLLAGRHDGEGPRGGDAEGVHRLAHDVLPQHRADRGPAVAAPGERRGPGALEVEVAADTVDVADLAQQQGAAVAEPW